MNGYCAAVRSGIFRGRPFAAGVLCSRKALAEAWRGLERLAASTAPELAEGDFTELDRLMAEQLAADLPRSIPAAAMSCRVWDIGPCAGGVVGAPHGSSESAGGALEELEPGLWSCAYPGGPGFVLAGERRTALKAQELIAGLRWLRWPVWPEFQRWAEAYPLRDYLFVSDGSGGEGLLAAAGENGGFVLTMNNLS